MRRHSSLAVVSFAACVMSSMAAGEEPKPDPVALELVGSLGPARLVNVESSIPARVVKVHVEEGDRVRAGDLLAELDDRVSRSKLELARAGLEFAKVRYREVSSAVAAEEKGRSSSKERLVVAEAEVKRAEAALSAAEHQLDETKVRAPIDGTILRRSVGAGDTVNPSGPGRPRLFEMADLNKLVAIVYIPESNWRSVHIGLGARIKVAAYPELALAGKLVRISPKVDSKTRCFAAQVEVEPPGPGVQLMPGMFARVSLLAK